MNDRQLDSIDNNSHQFKDEGCIARFCDKEGIVPLRIVYLNKIGRFCKYHSDDLVSLGLATHLRDVRGIQGIGTTENKPQNKGEHDG